MQKTNTQKLKGKDFVTIGIFSIIFFVVFLVVSMLVTPFIAVIYPFIGGICALFIAPVYMLMTYKVAKRGTVLLFATVVGLIYAIMGYVFMLPIIIVAGILCEVVLWKRETYRSFWHNAASYSVFSVLVFVATAYIPIYVFGTEYYMQVWSDSSETAAIHIKFAMSPLWVAVTVVVTVVAAIIGGLIGRRLLRKHFMKAGLISAE